MFTECTSLVLRLMQKVSALCLENLTDNPKEIEEISYGINRFLAEDLDQENLDHLTSRVPGLHKLAASERVQVSAWHGKCNWDLRGLIKISKVSQTCE